MLEYQGIWRSAGDVKLTAVDSAMVHAAEAELVVGVMRPAFGARLDVVHVEREGVSAARYLTRLLVAQ